MKNEQMQYYVRARKGVTEKKIINLRTFNCSSLKMDSTLALSQALYWGQVASNEKDRAGGQRSHQRANTEVVHENVL